MRFPAILTFVALALVANSAPVPTFNCSAAIDPLVPQYHDTRRLNLHEERGSKKNPKLSGAAKGKKSSKLQPSSKPVGASSGGSITSHSFASPSHNDTTTEIDLSLFPLIQNFNAPTKLTMEGTSRNSRVLSTAAMTNAKIPPFRRPPLGPQDPEPFSLSLGDLDVTLETQERYVAKDQELWKEAESTVTTAGSRCMAKQCLLPISGEADLTDKMMTLLAQPAMHILDALHNPSPGVIWHVQGLGNGPKTDIILKAGKEIDTIFNNLAAYKMTETLPQGKADTSKALSLTRSNQGVLYRDPRLKDIVMVEQVIAQMYRYDVKYGALTNFYTYLLFERDGNNFKVTKREGVVDGQNKGMEIILGLSLKATGYEL